MRLPSIPAVSLLLAVLLAGALAAEATPLPRKVHAIAEAEAAELARLEAEIARTTDPGAVLSLQRCATYVKLASRLALHEAQLAATADDDLHGRLEALALDLHDRIRNLAPDLPESYAFDPLAAVAEEVAPCAE